MEDPQRFAGGLGSGPLRAQPRDEPCRQRAFGLVVERLPVGEVADVMRVRLVGAPPDADAHMYTRLFRSYSTSRSISTSATGTSMRPSPLRLRSSPRQIISARSTAAATRLRATPATGG